MFLGAGILAVVAMLLWITMLHTEMGAQLPGGPLWWHMHEMVFGFAGGSLRFLLTAVQNWTGVPSISKHPLLLMFSPWLTAAS